METVTVAERKMSVSTVIHSGRKVENWRLSQQRRLKADTWMRNKAAKCGINVRGYERYREKEELDQRREKKYTGGRRNSLSGLHAGKTRNESGRN